MLHRFPKGLPATRCTRSGCRPGAPTWVETVQLHFPRWNRTADELCVTELGSGDLGGADVDGRVPPVEQPSRRHREARRVADRPRPRAALRLRPGAARGRTWPTRCSTSSGAVGFPKTSGGSGLHVYVRIPPDHGHKEVRRAALAFAREVERRMPDDVTTPVVAQGPRPASPVRGLQPERPRPHHRRGVLRPRLPRRPGLHAGPLGRGRRRRPPRLHHLHGAGPVRRARRPARRHRRPRLRHRSPLLEWADRDEANGLTSTTGPGTAQSRSNPPLEPVLRWFRDGRRATSSTGGAAATPHVPQPAPVEPVETTALRCGPWASRSPRASSPPTSPPWARSSAGSRAPTGCTSTSWTTTSSPT